MQHKKQVLISLYYFFMYKIHGLDLLEQIHVSHLKTEFFFVFTV
jgi:hypothetical protein